MLGMHFSEPEIIYTACGPFTKTQCKYKHLNKHEILDILIKTDDINHVFNMIRPMTL